MRTDVSFWKIWIYKTIEKLASFLPGKVVASSDCEQKAYDGIRVNSKLIYNGAKVHETNKSRKEDNTIRIVNCGVISTQKNPSLFNEIANSFLTNEKVKFVWIGDGVDQHLLDSNNIQITGWKSKKDVFEILLNSDLYLSTSLWEGLPLAGIEAMGSGLPLVLKSCPGNDNLVEMEENGFLFEIKFWD